MVSGDLLELLPETKDPFAFEEETERVLLGAGIDAAAVFAKGHFWVTIDGFASWPPTI